MTTLETLKERYADVRAKVAAAARRGGREPADVVIIAVSKYGGVDDIRELMSLGLRDFGENQVQQLMQRAAMIAEWQARQKTLAHHGSDPAARWHMVGHLQRNKVRKAVELSRLIHSIDSLRLAEEIQAVAIKREEPVEVLLQVNTSGEASKFGCAVGAAIHLAEQLDSMVNVRLRGLMTLGPITDDPEQSRTAFARLREVYGDIAKAGIGKGYFNLLSMGMSGDYELAIAEGSNVVRIGSAIFGERAANADGSTDDREPPEA